MDNTNKQEFGRLGRYIVSGVAATIVHFCALWFNLEMLHMPSAGMANFFAAIVGIATSFIGNRYFVFRHTAENILRQASKFVLVYALIACVHALVLLVWSDLLHLDYRIGFLIAVLLQVILGYIGNKTLVFKHETI
jgi:putative flippase GtrA